MPLMCTTSGITSQPLHQSPLARIQNSRVEKDLLLGNWTLVTFSPKGWGEVSSPVFPIWEPLRDGGSTILVGKAHNGAIRVSTLVWTSSMWQKNSGSHVKKKALASFKGLK